MSAPKRTLEGCPVGDGKHYFVRESDDVMVCQKCGQVALARVREAAR